MNFSGELASIDIATVACFHKMYIILTSFTKTNAVDAVNTGNIIIYFLQDLAT